MNVFEKMNGFLNFYFAKLKYLSKVTNKYFSTMKILKTFVYLSKLWNNSF